MNTNLNIKNLRNLWAGVALTLVMASGGALADNSKQKTDNSKQRQKSKQTIENIVNHGAVTVPTGGKTDKAKAGDSAAAFRPKPPKSRPITVPSPK